MEGIGWDEELPYHLKAEWKKWFKELGELDTVRVPRCLKEEKEVREVTIHTFSDASARKPTPRHRMYAMSMQMGE